MAERARRAAPPTQTALERLLRDAYAPPDDPAYWDHLEVRIMARVQRGTGRRPVRGWQAAFTVWARAGVAAACAAAAAAGVATWSIHKTEGRVAYESVLGVAQLPVQSQTRFIDVSDHEASVRYVLSH
jgi:hypothetical protein